MELAEIVRRMSNQADQTVLITDSDKYGHTGFAHMFGIDEIDVLVTDSGLKKEDKARLAKQGVQIEIA
jgi:DeoR/GlpR family transcriptional regulator of sugar metabolism